MASSWKAPILAFFISTGVLVAVNGCLVTPVEAAPKDVGVNCLSPGAFDSYETMQAELEKMRQACKPFLRSLPEPLKTRKRVPVAGTWRFAYEVKPTKLTKDYSQGQDVPHIPPPEKWYTKDFDDGSWEKVTVPEWRYPSKEFIAWYRTSFSAPVVEKGNRAFLVFQGVDWAAQVWLNGRFLGSHTTYYEPFRFDVTDILEDNNVLAVRVIEGQGYGEPLSHFAPLPQAESNSPRFTRDNRKDFLSNLKGKNSTHIGTGGGLLREVYLEYTDDVFVNMVFARADLQNNLVNVKVEVDAQVNRDASIDVQIIPENFAGRSYRKVVGSKLPADFSVHEIAVPVSDARLWSPGSPYLYRCRVAIKDGSEVVDAQDVLFGYRSFSMASEEDGRKTGVIPGTFYLNGEPVFLRGTNLQGLNMWWYWGEEKKLIDCLLMLKIANFNMIRITQHVNFPEVREYLDRLGIMSQQDQGAGVASNFRGFSQVTYKNVSAPALIATARPLARVCYNNPGVILLSFANEIDLEASWTKQIADEVIKVDPQRIIKPVSGYIVEFPEGYSKHLVADFFAYVGWYGNAAGRVYNMPRKFKGARDVASALIGVRVDNIPKKLEGIGRMTVGEYGGEALDCFETMKSCYPPQFEIPDSPEADMLMARSTLTHGMALKGYLELQKADLRQRAGFYGKIPRNLGQYIEASQNYQALILTEMTAALRISAQRISGYMQFHFVDPVPAYFPYAIVGPDFRPKKAYYQMAKLNRPLVPLFQLQKGGRFMEVWIANDLATKFKNCKVTWKLEAGGKTLLTGEKTMDVPASNAILVEKVDLAMVPQDTKLVTVSLQLADPGGKQLACYEREVWLELWRKESAALE